MSVYWKGRAKPAASLICIGITSALFLIQWASSTSAISVPGVRLGPAYTRQAEAGETISYNHILTNTGGTTDTFLLEVLSTQGWPVDLLSDTYPQGTTLLPIQAGAQMTASFRVSLRVPLNVTGVTEITIITATSQLSPTVQDTVSDRTTVYHRIYFPFWVKRWPPVPYLSTLNPIDNTDKDGIYTVNWPLTELAQTYSLEEDDDSAFSGPTEVYSGAGRTWSVPAPGKIAGTYYYRVRGHNEWGYGGYSNIEAVAVSLPDTPVLDPIDNTDGDVSYSVTWSEAARATGYALQEDTDWGFGNPATVYGGTETSWLATEKLPGTYYYRVSASGPTGQSGWSNVQAAWVGRFRADSVNLTAGECTTLRWDFSGIKALYISFGYGYDREGVTGHGTREVCPSVTTTYEALVVKVDNSHERHYVTIDVSGSGCADPVIQRFSSTAYHIAPGQPFSIFWDVECAATIHLIQGSGPEEPVTGHGSRIDVTIYTNTVFKLQVKKINGDWVYASFTVYVTSQRR